MRFAALSTSYGAPNIDVTDVRDSYVVRSFASLRMTGRGGAQCAACGKATLSARLGQACADGLASRQLRAYEAGDFHTVWSPDSRWIAYTRQLDSSLHAVFVYGLDDKTPHQITDGLSDAASPVMPIT